MKPTTKLVGAGIMTAIASSLCCIAPLLTLLAGGSSFASSFAWMEPLRPYLIGVTVIILCYAWWEKLKPSKATDCGCDEEAEKTPFFKRTLFLGIITIFTVLMTAFPYYSSVFYSSTNNEYTALENNVQKVKLTISGMTCEACEHHVDHAIGQINGVLSTATSYNEESSIIEFDKTVTTVEDLVEAVKSTGYEATNIK